MLGDSPCPLPFHALSVENYARAVACVNALAGVEDPEATVRELIVVLELSIQWSPYKGESEETDFLRRARAALAKVKGKT